MQPLIKKIRQYKPRIKPVIWLLGYIAVVFCYTVLCRSVGYREIKTEFLWSYKEWFSGNWSVGFQILGNIVLFIPFGFLFSDIKVRHSYVYTIICAFLFSVLIEWTQMFSWRGFFEWDDVLHNTIGAVCGSILYDFSASKENVFLKAYIIGPFSIILLCALCFMISNTSDNIPRGLCFHVEKVDGAQITGIAFFYGPRSQVQPEIRLRSNLTGEEIKIPAVMWLQSPDVEEYFNDGYDYSNVRFTADIEKWYDSVEYEFIAGYNPFVSLRTGVFITDGQIHYVREDKFVAPEKPGRDLVGIIQYATPRIYLPEEHCYVYQKDDCLYWIVDEHFNFAKDGTTLIQYQLWTTQTQNLPPERLENGYMWDNRSMIFEDCELRGDFGRYRVCCRRIPAEYPVVSIQTGYYYRKWIWYAFFRPIYNFLIPAQE